MKPYEIIGHTADVGLKANGSTLKELFENAAKGMFELIAGKKVSPSKKPEKSLKIKIKKDVDSFEELLVEWLSELLYSFSKNRILFSHFNVRELKSGIIVGEVKGDRVDIEKLEREIKAVTFHNLNILKREGIFTTDIIFDV